MGVKKVSQSRSIILDLLTKHSGTFVSGQEFSERLGISRTAIWKHIGALRAEGYLIESQKKSGYRLIKKPNSLSAVEIQSGLETEQFGYWIHYEETVSSTQEIANTLVQEGAQEGTLIIAEEQISGKGRLGRSWHSPKGTGINASLILRPNIPPREAPQLTLLAAVGIVKGIKQTCGLDCDIKWPNDILYHGKKLVGILTELQAEPDRIHAVLLGMGLNVNVTEAKLPVELREKATSLRIETEREIDRAQLLQHILREIEILYEDYLQEGFRFVKLLWESYAISLGRTVHARTLKGVLVGRAKGLNDDGFLLLEDENGATHQISSADIELPYDQ